MDGVGVEEDGSRGAQADSASAFFPDVLHSVCPLLVHRSTYYFDELDLLPRATLVLFGYCVLWTLRVFAAEGYHPGILHDHKPGEDSQRLPVVYHIYTIIYIHMYIYILCIYVYTYVYIRTYVGYVFS